MNKRNLWILAVIILTVIIGYSCKKDTGIIGLDLQGDDSKIKLLIDSSFVFKSYNIQTDEFLTSSSGYALIGAHENPDFCSSSSFFVSQLIPENNAPSIENLQFDSITFDFYIYNIFGNDYSEMEFELYEVTDNLTDFDSVYSSDFNVDDYFNYPLSDNNAQIYLNTINWRDSNGVYVDSLKHTANVHFRLNEYAENKLIHYGDSGLKEVVRTNAAFRDYFRGIMIRSNHPGVKNSYVNFIKTDIDNVMSVHYTKTDTVVEGDSTYYPTSSRTFKFKLYKAATDTVQGFNIFNHEYAPDISIDDPDALDTITYVQTMNGLNTVIDLQELSKWRDSSNIIINSALLYIYYDSIAETDFSTPTQLFIYQHNEDIDYTLLPDYSSTGSGQYSLIDENNSQFVIRLTEYLQDYIFDENENLDIRIGTDGNLSTVKRLDIYSGNHSRRPKLYITYSKL